MKEKMINLITLKTDFECQKYLLAKSRELKLEEIPTHHTGLIS